MKQTAVEWLESQLTYKLNGQTLNNCYDWKDLTEYYNKAKEMEKQQIIDAKNDPKNYDAYWDNDVLISSGEVYYNETYEKY
jgi:hypothetical protein